MKRIAIRGIGLLLSIPFLGLGAYAQNGASAPASQSGDSLADYARSIRKDSGAKTKPRVFDNDNLPVNDKLSIVGPAESTAENSAASKPADAQTSAPAADEAKPATADKAASETKTEGSESKSASTEVKTDSKAGNERAPAPGTSKPEDDASKQAAWKQWSEKLAAQKDQIDLLERELNVLQREYQIRAAAMYGDAGNRLRNSGDWDKQDAQYKQQIADKQKSVDDAKQKLDDIQEEARKAGVPTSARE